MDLAKPNIVGTIGSIDDMERLKAIIKDYPGKIDIAEVRIDLIKPEDLEYIEECLDLIRESRDISIIITVRDKSENGKEDDEGLLIDKRKVLFEQFLPYADAIDIEVKLLGSFRDIITKAKKSNTILIASFHDFKGVPPLHQIRNWIMFAKGYQAKVFKLAVTIEASEFEVLHSLFDETTGIHLSIMSMGDYSKQSRLDFARAGSVFNYCHVGGEAVAPGQWFAPELKAKLEA